MNSVSDYLLLLPVSLQRAMRPQYNSMLASVLQSMASPRTNTHQILLANFLPFHVQLSSSKFCRNFLKATHATRSWSGSELEPPCLFFLLTTTSWPVPYFLCLQLHCFFSVFLHHGHKWLTLSFAFNIENHHFPRHSYSLSQSPAQWPGLAPVWPPWAKFLSFGLSLCLVCHSPYSGIMCKDTMVPDLYLSIPCVLWFYCCE